MKESTISDTLKLAAARVSLHCIYCKEVRNAPMKPEEYIDFLDTHEERCGPKAVGGIFEIADK